jgi:uncharacterized protein YjiS (DUF1127 family)
MANTIHNHFSLGKFGAMLFARQAPINGAPTHPSLFEKFSAWRDRRAATRELSGLSDRELADIGLTRQEIASAVGRVQK